MKWKQTKYKQIFQMYKKLYDDNKELSLFYSKCINLKHLIVQDMAKVKATEFIRTGKEHTGAKPISELYEIKIIHNFVAHQTLLKNGVSVASYSHLRTIYETILRIYLSILYPDLANINFKQEIGENNRRFGAGFMEEKLYSEDTVKSTRLFYDKLCKSIHPSINAMRACFDFIPNTFMDSYKVGIGLTQINFMVLFELYGDKIKKKHKKKLLELVKEYPKFIEATFALTPTKNTEKLLLKSYNDLIELLETHP